MIVIGNNMVKATLSKPEHNSNAILREILNKLQSSNYSYIYDTKKDLSFDLTLRLLIIKASEDLLKSNMQFQVFRKSYCNPMFWIRTPLGGFKIRPGIPPSLGLLDIFRNGQFYATECATAIIIIFYKALLDLYGPKTFDELFNGLLLYTWNYDTDLVIRTASIKNPVPGDVVYFKNPDVSPFTPEWQGENTVSMGNNLFYGHGIGVRTPLEIVYYLNMHRYPFAMISAYLTDYNTHVDPNEMSKYLTNDSKLIPIQVKEIGSNIITARIGDQSQIA
ncbi:protein-glutamine gamma-glutamyltransferase [Bacillus sp. RG28]|uniref:Protein-glutamine gamma-glutamyltransferase n=1 Tax=Gottfriedia endophytica TaxID=2820819 RepID=A0A940SG69_9BACI|nr:protein-glutamine gamma-glutamyltransferase [Gottfriedia endophytica]MBP0724757.1 protein-glutamine gamma-glutamyltransferase [Gottfriedia endophytica]